MVCGCEFCGTLMVQEQHGVEGRCVCPKCGASCDICLGFEHPLSAQEIRELLENGTLKTLDGQPKEK